MTASTTQFRDGELIAERRLRATPEQVWEAFTRPASLAAFWGGTHAMVPPESVEVNLRAGGGFALDTQAPDGSRHRLRFLYRRLAAPQEMVFDEPLTGIRTTITLRGVGEDTCVSVHQRELPHELQTERAAEGLASTLDALATYLEITHLPR
ncbi:SRPBCC family protein [Ruania alba]|uniref:Uncharacterized conserved protein YndB, AHSA1/START domain n=1 Tax=Ruania alba TaxID=648782 RepID=A0A1H5DJ92_9MICO|nr:Uncharacterized conserved protein YndB, AHSA1/START domain [Ruania alba]